MVASRVIQVPITRDALTKEEELEVAVPQALARRGTSNCRRGSGVSTDCGFHNSTRRLMISPAANSVSRSCSSSWAMACANHVRFASLRTFPHRSAFGGELDIHLAAVGGMRLALDQAHFLKRRDGGSHRLRFHAFRARQIGGGGGSVFRQARHDGGLGQ